MPYNFFSCSPNPGTLSPSASLSLSPPVTVEGGRLEEMCVLPHPRFPATMPGSPVPARPQFAKGVMVFNRQEDRHFLKRRQQIKFPSSIAGKGHGEVIYFREVNMFGERKRGHGGGRERNLVHPVIRTSLIRTLIHPSFVNNLRDVIYLMACSLMYVKSIAAAASKQCATVSRNHCGMAPGKRQHVALLIVDAAENVGMIKHGSSLMVTGRTCDFDVASVIRTFRLSPNFCFNLL